MQPALQRREEGGYDKAPYTEKLLHVCRGRCRFGGGRERMYQKRERSSETSDPDGMTRIGYGT